MTKYRTKVKVSYVDAVQWFPGVEIDGVYEDPPAEMCDKVWHQVTEGRAWYEPDGDDFGKTIESGDWIITFANGSKWSWSDDYFRKCYEVTE